jgi:hypothetical protein
MPEYSSVKVIAVTGNTEVVYEIFKAEKFTMITDYEEPDIRTVETDRVSSNRVERIVFAMFPNSNASGTYMRITRSTRAIPVVENVQKPEDGMQDWKTVY